MNRFSLLAKFIAVCAVAAFGAGCGSLPGTLGSTVEVGDRWHISADFDNTAGLYSGNEVDVLGVPVGRVDSIEARGRYVQVTMSIDKSVKLPAQAMAALVNPQLITNRHVELAPAYTDGPTMADGAHIPLPRTRTPVELDRILQTFDQIGASLAGDNQTGPMASRVLYPLLNGNGDRLRETLDALSAAFQTTLANKDQISETVVKLNQITQVIAANDRTVRDFSGQLTQIAALLGQQSPGLQAVLTQLNDFVTNTASVVGQNKDQLGGSLHRFVTITAQMRANARNLTESTDLIPLTFQNVSNSIDPHLRVLQVHALTDKSVLDNEALSTLCERLAMRADGCRTGKMADFGPDFGLTAALLGITKK